MDDITTEQAIAAAKILINAGVSINETDNYDCAVLHQAIRAAADLKFIKFLFKKGANVNQNSYVPLQLFIEVAQKDIMAKRDTLEYLKVLVSYGAYIDDKEESSGSQRCTKPVILMIKK